MNPTFQRCPTHQVELLQRDNIRSSKPTSGLWCPTGHWSEMWEVVDQVTSIVVFRASRKGGPIAVGMSQPVSILLPAWACCCARCGHGWWSACDCAPAEPGKPFKHAATCEPPDRCAGCKARNWRIPKGA